MPACRLITLLLALPASGKSEVRRYLAHLTPDQCRDEMHLGPTVQLDDYPYVHFMHRIDDELVARHQPAVFYKGPARPFLDNFTWGVLIELPCSPPVRWRRACSPRGRNFGPSTCASCPERASTRECRSGNDEASRLRARSSNESFAAR